MKIDVKKDVENSEVELKIEASADELKPYLNDAAKKLSKEKSIKGFRPGKAPVEVVEEVFGLGPVLNEVVDRAVPRFFVEAVMDEGIEALAQPSIAIDEISKDKGLKFTAKVAVLPQVTLGDLSKIEVEKRSAVVSDEDVEKELQNLAKMRGSFIDVARPAEKGDTVKLDFKISVNGVPLEGGESKDHPVQIGEGHFVGDFEDKLIGIQAGDVREFKIKFPEDYKKNKLGGKEADAWVKAGVVQKKVVAKVDDAFAKELGKFDSLAELKKQMKDNLKHEREHKEKERYHGEMTSKLAEGAEYTKIPEALINKEVDRLLNEFQQMLSMQQKGIEDYLKSNNRTIEQVREEMKPNAEKSVKVGLALKAFATQEDVKVEESEIEKKAQEYLQRFGTTKEAKKEIDPEDLKEQLTYMLRNQKAMEALEKVVIVKESEGPAGDAKKKEK
jgi:trigger factor